MTNQGNFQTCLRPDGTIDETKSVRFMAPSYKYNTIIIWSPTGLKEDNSNNYYCYSVFFFHYNSCINIVVLGSLWPRSLAAKMSFLTFQRLLTFSNTVCYWTEQSNRWYLQHKQYWVYLYILFNSKIRKWFEPRSSIPWLKKIIWVIGVLRRTVVSDWRFDNLCGSHLQSQVVVLVSWKFKNPGERFDWSIDRVAVGKYVMWLAVKTCRDRLCK